MKTYLINVAASISVNLNTLLGGSYRNTFSARTGYASHVLDARWAKRVERVIDSIFGDKHCYREYLNEYQ